MTAFHHLPPQHITSTHNHNTEPFHHLPHHHLNSTPQHTPFHHRPTQHLNTTLFHHLPHHRNAKTILNLRIRAKEPHIRRSAEPPPHLRHNNINKTTAATRERKREPPPHATLHLRPDLCAPLFLSGRPQLPVRASLSFSGRRSLSRNFDQRLEVKEVEENFLFWAFWFQFKKLQGKSSYGEEELELMDSQVCEVKTGFDESFSKVIHQRTLNNQGHWVVLDKIAVQQGHFSIVVESNAPTPTPAAVVASVGESGLLDKHQKRDEDTGIGVKLCI
ncbi:hypothetical protein P8452_31801 [Trifolium repens]|nr:hypothetical protein P8452_31801 [Trifolium repens]